MHDHRKVAIVGVGITKIERRSGRTVGQLALEACRKAIEDAGLGIEAIDGISNYAKSSRPYTDKQVDGVDLVSAEYLSQALGLDTLTWACAVDRGTVTAALVEAVHALASGACRYALVWRAMGNPQGSYGRRGYSEVRGADQFSIPWGFGHNTIGFALAYSRYMAKYGATREHMATFIERNRRNAARNPNAVFFEKPITRADYLASKMIADPICMLDCDMPVDGCGAFVLTTADRAADLRQPPVFVTGTSSFTMPPRRAIVATLEDAVTSAGRLARALWANAGCSAKDITHLQLYDGISWFIYVYLEAFGIVPEGEAFQMLQENRTEWDGPLPLNTGGGALGMGRMHGIPQLLEAVLQIRGQAGARQIADPSMALVCSGQPARGAAAVTLSA